MLCVRMWVLLCVSAIVVILDQTTKWLVVTKVLVYQTINVNPMLNLVRAYNTGAAFSFLANTGPWHSWFFIILSIAIILGLFSYLYQTEATERLQGFGFALILGGAIGNLIDRLHWGYVIDFIDVHYTTYHWPAFNLADSAICLGAILLGIDLFRRAN